MSIAIKKTSVTVNKDWFLFLRVVFLSMTISLIYFWYNFVWIKYSWNLSELFENKKALKSKNGVVGSIGKIIPIAPNTNDIIQNIINNIFMFPPVVSYI